MKIILLIIILFLFSGCTTGTYTSRTGDNSNKEKRRGNSI